MRSRLVAPPATTPFASHFEIADYDMMRPLMIAACFALTSVASVASAQEAAQASPAPAATAAPLKGNADTGRQLTYTCQGCHGVTGYKNAYPNYHVPKIGGQSAEYLVNALTEYKKGARKHPTMQAQAQSFSDQDIADIAAFLSTLK
jgi:cytochrome c553